MSKREFHTSKQAYQRQLEALDRMREYCEEGVRCRRNLLVEHFGEQPQHERLCDEEGNVPCDNCEGVPRDNSERVMCDNYKGVLRDNYNGNGPRDNNKRVLRDKGGWQRHGYSPTTPSPMSNRFADCNKHPKNQ